MCMSSSAVDRFWSAADAEQDEGDPPGPVLSGWTFLTRGLRSLGLGLLSLLPAPHAKCSTLSSCEARRD